MSDQHSYSNYRTWICGVGSLADERGFAKQNFDINLRNKVPRENWVYIDSTALQLNNIVVCQ